MTLISFLSLSLLCTGCAALAIPFVEKEAVKVVEVVVEDIVKEEAL